MASTEKYQAGESYGDEKKKSDLSLDDPVKLAAALMKELHSVHSQISLQEAIDIIKSLTQKPLDDKTG